MIFYDFDVEMKRNLLFKIIKICEEQCDCKIRGIVCDMGNKGLLNQLGVRRKTWSHFFVNPAVPSRFVYIFPDIPHCVKNLRNHTLDSGMVIKVSPTKTMYLNKQHFLDLLQCDNGDLSLCHRVTLAHLEVRGMDRQRVRPAMQLFSESVSLAFLQLFGEKYRDQSSIIGTIDDWIDTMNSRHKYDNKSNRCGLGKISEKFDLKELNQGPMTGF